MQLLVVLLPALVRGKLHTLLLQSLPHCSLLLALLLESVLLQLVLALLLQVLLPERLLQLVVRLVVWLRLLCALLSSLEYCLRRLPGRQMRSWCR